jgi:hypothetical protein
MPVCAITLFDGRVAEALTSLVTPHARISGDELQRIVALIAEAKKAGR